MTKKVILQRKRIFFAAEGESEQSFIRFLQFISDQQHLSVHLDCEVLNGGGYKTMLERAACHRIRKGRNKIKGILIVDTDRAEKNDDGWSIEKLRAEANKQNLYACFQTPNLEGLLLRMLPGKERLQPKYSTVQKQLSKEWKEYQKPVDARTLISKFTLDDLLRVAKVDADLKHLLETIGLIRMCFYK